MKDGLIQLAKELGAGVGAIIATLTALVVIGYTFQFLHELGAFPILGNIIIVVLCLLLLQFFGKEVLKLFRDS